jgi:hypothetical protein
VTLLLSEGDSQRGWWLWGDVRALAELPFGQKVTTPYELGR